MFENKLQHIELSGKEYPIKFDNFVLAEIQDMYGIINTFELKIRGLVPKKDETGNVVYDDWQRPVFYKVDPSVKAINDVLPLMIAEGCEIEKKELEETTRQLVEMIDIPYQTLAQIIIEEYDRCFASKKYEPKSKESDSK